jgi:hypothetical protein
MGQSSAVDPVEDVVDVVAYDAAAAAAYYAADVAYDAAYANKAKRVNQLQTANICREILGAHIIEKVNQLLTK